MIILIIDREPVQHLSSCVCLRLLCVFSLIFLDVSRVSLLMTAPKYAGSAA